MKKFWKWTNHRIRNQDSGEEVAQRVLELYGTIAEESWFDDDITPQMFRDELFSGSDPVTIWINSPGGDCIAASQIYTMLMDYKGDVTIKIDGIAASAASVIAMAGTKVLMAPTAMMMLHNPATIAFGDHVDMEKAIEMLSEVKESIINAYEIKTSLPRRQLSKMMDETTWMNAKKAVELGFADDILSDEKLSSAAEAYEFSQSAVENALVNKLSARMDLKALTAAVGVTDKATEKQGRSVDDLMERLKTMKKYI
ncbi:head maturation protease, ClpP-related [Ihubacter sp. mB4P-1]|uniref:head maturation protease, ClpP-related n=1 Tax=Ihubacter sp. mB4P-1 TaxID=3242370 RepID=UPI003C7D8E63